MEPFTVMVLSGLYRVRSCKLMGKPVSAQDPALSNQCYAGSSRTSHWFCWGARDTGCFHVLGLPGPTQSKDQHHALGRPLPSPKTTA